MSIEVTFHLETLEKLWKLPKDKNVLFVNLTEVMAREAIAQLNALGVNHLHFIPYRQGMALADDVDFIVTPAEMRYVPETDKPVIDIGQRPCSYSMMIEIALRLGLEHLLETETFANYEKSVVSKHYSFDRMFSIARRQESQFHILMEILNEGLVGINETGEIFACNKKACQIARVSEKLVIGSSSVLCKTKEMLRRMAATESPVLIVGETGTGKELMAHSVHRASARADGPFIAINVAAMPENLLESELFGYEDGAFTGARKGGKPGLFEFAHQGTLFLDEVEGMSASMQVKLLRVLQEREVMRVGGSSIVKVDVRVVAATNEFLEEKVEEGSFRRDLYYRLNALTVVLPPLRERGDDMFLLLEHFRDKIGGDFELAAETRKFLRAYAWPGNIRELHNAAEYFNYIGKPVIELEDLPPTMTKKLSRNTTSNDSAMSLHKEPDSLRGFILEQIFLAEQNGGSTGREALLQAAKQKGFLVSQKKIRDLLRQMEEEGLIIRGQGRSGSRLTSSGLKQYNS